MLLYLFNLATFVLALSVACSMLSDVVSLLLGSICSLLYFICCYISMIVCSMLSVVVPHLLGSTSCLLSVICCFSMLLVVISLILKMAPFLFVLCYLLNISEFQKSCNIPN